MADPTNPESVGQLVAADATYVSLNFDNPDLKRVMPWAGTSEGPAGIVQTFIDVARYWKDRTLEEIALFGDDRHAAVFGKMTYRSTVLHREVISPFCVYIEVEDGLCQHMQFMEDTFATTNSFRSGGHWHIHSNPDGEAIDVEVLQSRRRAPGGRYGPTHAGAAASARGIIIPPGRTANR